MVTRVMIMAGGTGGHVFPALAVAEKLRAEGVDVVWMGTREGLEAEVVRRAGIPMTFVKINGLRGKGVISWLFAPFRLCYALFQSLVIIMRIRPMAVLGMGGFVSGPGGLMTWLLHKPLLVHEQNAIAGMTNRILAPLAKVALEGFPGALPVKSHPVTTGNPVRDEIIRVVSPQRRYENRSGKLRLLVVGGSLGAQALNECVPQAMKMMPKGYQLEIWHQAGKRNIDATKQAYKKAGIEARVEPFIDNIAHAYEWADLVLCRAGALTIAELSVAGIPAILVPYPFAVDDHQTVNANYLADAGAAILIQQHELTPERLCQVLSEISGLKESASMQNQLKDGLKADMSEVNGYMENHGRNKLLAMAKAALKLAKPDAAERVASLCIRTAHA
ncbi:MAG: undecaprenyldiphospho-muramoylpentapeptide beta-N-acetylglucosaminyltransferase [Gammaproteobacteria bacterium]